MQDDRHGDLGALLRSWRDRLSPLDVGLPAGDSRRAAGLRREELAALAGLSVDYVVRLEQGRARRPSAQVAAALARALQLNDAERDHLFVVSGLLPPSPREVPSHIPPGVQRLVARLGETPVAVFTAAWDLISWSPLWAALLGEPVRPATGRPNLVRSMFTGEALHRDADETGMGTGIGAGTGTAAVAATSPAAGTSTATGTGTGTGTGTATGTGESRIVSRSGSLDAFGASLVADLRRVQGRYPDDRRVNALVAELRSASERFRDLWESGAVGEHQSERKVVRSPLVGDLELDCDVFSVAGTDLRIVAYTAATGSEAAAKLDFLRVSAVKAAFPTV
ncbi:helix-turn-helix domain-containing protein [Subtercola boreus]|uniref:helix-turn-helix domain-containing protein n=1 Tax=Subtercola boreus TaxID=120213 RepID=UPI0015585897|nr:helix-turn-helix transcriptional regulator [Subtercola boreus]